MSKKAIIERLDAVLKPLGFLKRGGVWNRPSDSFVDVFDMQVSRDGDTFTFNAGVLDKAVHEVFWGEDTPDFVAQPQCTVGVRVGALIDGKDKWWSLDAADRDGEALEKSIQSVLGFFKEVHSRERMAQWLEDAEVTKKRYPPPILNLAILRALLGRSADAQAALNDLEPKISGPWKDRATQVRERLPV